MRILAHRGAAAHAPENTLIAFQQACELQADGIETDIRTTRDGVLVLIHDATVDRTTDGRGRVAELTFGQIRQLNAAARFGDGSHPQQRVPALAELLCQFAGRIPLTLEVKCPRAVKSLADLLKQHGLADSPAIEITSFEPQLLAELRALLPGLAMTWLLRTAIEASVLTWADEHQVRELGVKAALLTEADVQQARDAGLRVRAWGVKTLEQMHHAAACGVTGMTLDCLDWRAALHHPHTKANP